MKRVVLCITDDIATDQRLHRVCTTLLKHQYDPLLIGVKRSDIPLSDRPYKCKPLKFIFMSGKLFYAELHIRLFFLLLFSKADIITANDLDTLLPCYLASLLKRVPLVYDSHEYFTELPELVNRKLEKTIWTRIEELIFPKLRRVSTVGNYIAREYEKKYNVPVKVIRNLPSKAVGQSGKIIRRNVVIYQGSVNPGRGIELMIETMKLLPELELWIVGGGPELPAFKKISEGADNIRFKGKVSFGELSFLTRQAMIGFSLEEDLGLNYRYAMPNKLFDYMLAEVPSIVSDLPEMSAVVEEYKIGEVLRERSPLGLSRLVREMLTDSDRYENYVQNCRKASATLNWEVQEKELLSLYA